MSFDANTFNNESLVQQSPKFDYRIYGFDSVKEYQSFVKACKKLIRTTYEYKQWTQLLHKYPYTDVCSFTGFDRMIEIHHEPIRLQTYIETAITILMQNSNGFTSFDVLKLVIDWHYSNLVGWLPVTNIVHKKIHDGELFVPSFLIRGNWIEFVKQYWSFMPDNAMAKLYGYYQKHIELELPCTFSLSVTDNERKLHIEPNYEVINNLSNIEYLRQLMELLNERLNFDAIIREAMSEIVSDVK